MAAFAFSITSSIVYIINDVADSEKDKLHPIKKYRPVASGVIKPKFAIILAVLLFFFLIPILAQFRYGFSFILVSYFLLNLLYTFFLKEIVIVDIICIASGFMLRVLGGALVINVYISSWLILTTLFLSLFLAIMKRKSEIALLTNESNTRVVLKDYTLDFINQISSISAAGVIICYALYTVSERTIIIFGTENLVFTTIFFIFGVFRYMYIVYTQQRGENTIEIIIKDAPMIINGLLYGVSIIYFVYF
jgi:4-hydroxybenzoate polyprenyltransferase